MSRLNCNSRRRPLTFRWGVGWERRAVFFQRFAFAGDLAKGKMLEVSEDQAHWRDGHEGHQPEQNAATDSQFGSSIENVVQQSDGRQLSTSPYHRQLENASNDARAHQQDYLG